MRGFPPAVLVQCGASPSIYYESRAHLGTDELRKILLQLRSRVESSGGRFLFNTQMTDMEVDTALDGERKISALLLRQVPTRETPQMADDALWSEITRRCDPPAAAVGGAWRLPVESVVLGTGHSARPVFRALHRAGVALAAKDLAVGLRVQVRQKDVDVRQFGREAGHPLLGACARVRVRVRVFTYLGTFPRQG